MEALGSAVSYERGTHAGSGDRREHGAGQADVHPLGGDGRRRHSRVPHVNSEPYKGYLAHNKTSTPSGPP